MVNYIPCSQCDHRYANVEWYVKRPCNDEVTFRDGQSHTPYEIWCWVCYARELYYSFLADDDWRRDKG